MIWIRCDANSEIGMGHIMRCLSVADALEQLGEQVCFVIADTSAEGLLKGRGKTYFVLQSDYQNMEEELIVLLPRIQEEKPALLLIDSYRVAPTYLTRLKKHVRTAYIDDQYLFPYPVDLLINYNIYGDMLPYDKSKQLKETQLLLGTSYAPLRSEFTNVTYQIRDQVENVLITTGGSDKYNLAGLILEAAMKEESLAHVKFHVVSGAFNPHISNLEKLAKENPNIYIHESVTHMADLMKQCDVAITAGGSTMYELCAVGVPILCFSFVDNQEQIVNTFVSRKVVPFGGDYLKQGDRLPREIITQLILLNGDKKAREAYSRREKALVDGQGAMRIAKVLRCYQTNRNSLFLANQMEL